jgi:predicted nucleic acid-binding protein
MNSFYVDTNVILSFVEEDENFEKSKKVKEFKNLVTGEITVLELNSFYSRKLKDYLKAKATTIYALKVFNVSVIKIDFNKIMKEAIEVSPKLQLKTLDVLQLSSAKIISSTFVTFDKDILSKKEIIEKELNLKILEV